MVRGVDAVVGDLVPDTVGHITVEADDEEAALEQAFDKSQSICAQCSGWGQEWGLDDGNDWLTVEDFHGESHDPKMHGLTIEPA